MTLELTPVSGLRLQLTANDIKGSRTSLQGRRSQVGAFASGDVIPCPRRLIDCPFTRHVFNTHTTDYILLNQHGKIRQDPSRISF